MHALLAHSDGGGKHRWVIGRHKEALDRRDSRESPQSRQHFWPETAFEQSESRLEAGLLLDRKTTSGVGSGSPGSA
jgi:hypothetical protein